MTITKGDIVSIKPEHCDVPVETHTLYVVAKAKGDRCDIMPIQRAGKLQPVKTVQCSMIKRVFTIGGLEEYAKRFIGVGRLHCKSDEAILWFVKWLKAHPTI